MLTRLEQYRLNRLIDAYGDLSVEDALKWALKADAAAGRLGPFDPSYSRFAEEARCLVDLAELKEKAQCK